MGVRHRGQVFFNLYPFLNTVPTNPMFTDCLLMITLTQSQKTNWTLELELFSILRIIVIASTIRLNHNRFFMLVIRELTIPLFNLFRGLLTVFPQPI